MVSKTLSFIIDVNWLPFKNSSPNGYLYEYRFSTSTRVLPYLLSGIRGGLSLAHASCPASATASHSSCIRPNCANLISRKAPFANLSQATSSSVRSGLGNIVQFVRFSGKFISESIQLCHSFPTTAPYCKTSLFRTITLRPTCYWR